LWPQQYSTVAPLAPTKRGLKEEEEQSSAQEQPRCTTCPDEKGTERRLGSLKERLRRSCTTCPDEKGTERPGSQVSGRQRKRVAPLAPTKRGLKVPVSTPMGNRATRCTTCPDEKGTESCKSFFKSLKVIISCTTCPDEKGTERRYNFPVQGAVHIQLHHLPRRKGD